MINKAHTEPVTRFQRLIQAWIDADPARNPRDLARAAKLSPSVIYALRRDPLSNVPAERTFTALAAAGVARESVLRYAVALDLGLVPAGVELDDPQTKAMVRQLLEEQ